MKRVRQVLLTELESIICRLGGNRDGDGALGRDQGDLAAASVNHDLTADEIDRLTVRARKLRAALERFDVGDYGVCLWCEHPIPEARLKALPEAELCVGCEERREQEAAGRARDPRRWEEGDGQ